MAHKVLQTYATSQIARFQVSQFAYNPWNYKVYTLTKLCHTRSMWSGMPHEASGVTAQPIVDKHARNGAAMHVEFPEPCTDCNNGQRSYTGP